MSGKVGKTAAEVYSGEDYARHILDKAGSTGVKEFRAFGSTFVLPRERRFRTVQDAQDYVNLVRSQRWVRARWPDEAFREITVKERRDDKAIASYFRGSISLPPTDRFMRELSLLHEVAHHFGGGGHGTRFREAMYTLVGGMMDPQFGYLLRLMIETDMST